jgi:RNA polymerase sigma factor (sigma-70 family)
MVFRLCLRILQNEHDAEDAFQATFLILNQKATSLRPQVSLSGWLFSVARRVAQKARIAAARRRKHEDRAIRLRVADPLAQLTLVEAQEILECELSRLPDKFRAPLLLCYFEGLTRDEAAHQLGLSPSTLKSRLQQARARLRARLAVRGLAFSGVLVASLYREATASAAVPWALLESTTELARLVAAGDAVAPVVSPQVVALVEGVTKAMLTKLKITAGLLLLVAVSLGTAVMMTQAAADTESAKKGPLQVALAPAKDTKPIDSGELLRKIERTTWFVTKVDDSENTISLRLHPALAGEGGPVAVDVIVGANGAERVRSVKEGKTDEVSGITLQLPVAKEAEIVIDGRKGRLANLQPGMQVSFQMAADGATITGIDATTSGRAILKRVDAEKKTITVKSGGQEWTAPMGSNAKIVIKDKQDAQFSDLKIGMRVDVQLATLEDRIVVKAIQAQDVSLKFDGAGK